MSVHVDGKHHVKPSTTEGFKTSLRDGKAIDDLPGRRDNSSSIDQAMDLRITSDGRVFKNQEEVEIGELTANVVTELNLRHHSEGSSDFLSPFFEEHSSSILGDGGEKIPATHELHITMRGRVEPGRNHSLGSVPKLQDEKNTGIQTRLSTLPPLGSLPIALDAQQATRTGQELLRSMAMSRQVSTLYDDGLEIYPVRSKGVHSVVLGERAFEILKSRIASQPGSILLSTIFMQLSQMQPSALENAGLVLPVVPESIFDHTIASKPNFEFRVLPSKTVMFFTINTTILLGVIAGGILALFFSNTSV